jgi:hypothetical protein
VRAIVPHDVPQHIFDIKYYGEHRFTKPLKHRYSMLLHDVVHRNIMPSASAAQSYPLLRIGFTWHAAT